MKIEKIKFIFLIIVITILGIMPQAYAKTSIEIKPDATVVYTNKTISEFFDETMAMTKDRRKLRRFNSRCTYGNKYRLGNCIVFFK